MDAAGPPSRRVSPQYPDLQPHQNPVPTAAAGGGGGAGDGDAAALQQELARAAARLLDGRLADLERAGARFFGGDDDDVRSGAAALLDLVDAAGADLLAAGLLNVRERPRASFAADPGALVAESGASVGELFAAKARLVEALRVAAAADGRVR